MHVTLVDIHPGVLARALLILQLIRALPLARTPHAAVVCTRVLFYLYLGVVMPNYCEKT